MQIHGLVTIPKSVIEFSEMIKLENYKVTNPGYFRVRSLPQGHMEGDAEFKDSLARAIGVPKSRLDFVYFSASQGAEPHVDKLNPDKFEDTTYVIPVILPRGRSVIIADGDEVVAELGRVYQFDHTKTHSMTLEDKESGCVVIMAAIKRG